MRAMLIFYMYDQIKNGGLGIDQTTAMSIMSVYGALIYMSSIPVHGSQIDYSVLEGQP